MKLVFISGIWIFSFFCGQFSCMAQSDENLRVFFQDAEYFLMSEEYEEALNAYLKLYRANPGNANTNYRIGLCYLNIPGQKTRAIPYLEYASLHISEKYFESTYSEKNSPPQTLFLLATAYQIDNQLDKAIETFTVYRKTLRVNDVYEIDFVDKQIQACKRAEKFMKEPLNVKTRVLSDIIPQSTKNYNPVLSGDGNTLVYMTQEKFYQAVWMVKKQSENTWSNPVNITPQIESDGDTYPTSISPDGNTLYLVRMNNFGADIYVSHFERNRWTPMSKMDKPVNSRFWEIHASISPDGKTLYFVSNRKGSLGGQDIFRTQLNSRGKWGEPENLGPTINTLYHEDCAFITEDGLSLYFASQGHEGMGGFDTYRSDLQPGDTWSVPVNLGYPVNSTDDNIFFYPVEKNKTALYAGPILPEEDHATIKEIVLLPRVTEMKITLKGNVTLMDAADFPEDTRVIVSKIGETNWQDTLKPDPESGEFSLVINPGLYSITASASNYETLVERLSVEKDFERSELNLNLELTSTEVSSGEYLAVKNLLFGYNSAELKDTAILEIERLYQLMLKYPELYIEIIGHTDSRGTPGYNLELSKKRANSVLEYLVSRGLERTRFVTRGLGETNNLAININPDGSDNPEGRKLNRCVEIKILPLGGHKITIEPIEVPDYLKPKRSSHYTILLTQSETPLARSFFTSVNQITQEEVSENLVDSTYLYTLGLFYSVRHAEEVKKSAAFRNFPDAKVINRNNLQQHSYLASTIINSTSDHFGIQLAALKNPANSRNYSHLDEAQVKKCDDGLYRVIFGQYESEAEAEADLQELRNRGYSDAFIIDLKRFDTSSSKNTNAPNFENLTIQLRALKVPVGKNYFKPLIGIREIQGDDGLFRYIIGDFETMEAALEELKRIQRMGYQDAFIRETIIIPGY